MNKSFFKGLWPDSLYGKITFISVLGLVVLLAGGWGITYGFAPMFTKLSPSLNEFLPTATPIIATSLKYAPFAKLSKVKLELDGKDVSSNVVKGVKSFKYTPSQPLSEGKHTAKVALVYSYLFKRKVNLKWDFTTDTVPPGLDFANLAGDKIGSRKKKVEVEGTTEPYSTLDIRFNSRAVNIPQVGGSGRFTLNLSLPKKKNDLKVVAKDRAGNRSERGVIVVYDTTPPQIVSLAPAPDTTAHTDSPRIEVKVNEPDSAVLAAKLLVDNQPVQSIYDPEAQVLTYVPKVYFDGKHKAYVEITDAASNVTKTEWSFSIDSAKIVVHLSQRRLYFYKGGQLQKTYIIAIGSPSFPTPKGNWKIVSKRKNPSWHNPGTDWAKSMPESIPPGPNNPLGQRALDLSAPGVRIHGTPNIGSVGSAVSHSCMRMYPWDIEVLFEQVSVGTPVTITN